jgi:uncharacterized protein
MIFIDTGYLVAMINPRDALHTRAVEWSRRLREPTLVTQFVLIETVNSFSAPAFRKRCHEVVERLLSMPSFEVTNATPEWFELGMTFHRSRPDKEWSLTDCISFIEMRDRGITRALTYDHHFEQAGFEALLRRDP